MGRFLYRNLKRSSELERCPGNKNENGTEKIAGWDGMGWDWTFVADGATPRAEQVPCVHKTMDHGINTELLLTYAVHTRRYRMSPLYRGFPQQHAEWTQEHGPWDTTTPARVGCSHAQDSGCCPPIIAGIETVRGMEQDHRPWKKYGTPTHVGSPHPQIPYVVLVPEVVLELPRAPLQEVELLLRHTCKHTKRRILKTVSHQKYKRRTRSAMKKHRVEVPVQYRCLV